MSTWKQFAAQVLATEASWDDRADRDDNPENGPIGPSVPIVSPPLDPSRALKLWHAKLSALDDCAAPAGSSTMWWQQACHDAFWVYENFAGQAARDGWSAHDLFGILPWHPGWGGITCRLRGSRNLKMDADFAAWTHHGVPDRLARGFGPTLISSGLVPIWELQP